jgi:hypothetical protein
VTLDIADRLLRVVLCAFKSQCQQKQKPLRELKCDLAVTEVPITGRTSAELHTTQLELYTLY